MMTRIRIILLFCVGMAHPCHGDQNSERDQQWPHWRGPRADGTVVHGDPPLQWSQSENIRWKQPVPGEGSATPIIWKDRIYVVSAVKTERRSEEPSVAAPGSRTQPPDAYYQFNVYCLDRESGEVRWSKTLVEAVPHEGLHSTNTYASGSPSTDGSRLYVSFGSRGIFCLSMDGEILWQRELGKMRTRRGWGEAVTPTLAGGSLVVQWDHEDQSFIEVMDVLTGDTIWKKDRDEPSVWATPLVSEFAGRQQVIAHGTNRVRSYDLKSGDLVWEAGGHTVNAIPSPMRHGDNVICLSGYRGSLACSIPLSAKGDVTDSGAIAWSYRSGTPYVPSAVICHDQLYFNRTNTGVVTCLSAQDGSVIFGPERVSGLANIYASPIVSGDRIYYVGRDGTTVVLKHGDKLDILAVNKLDDPIDASPAVIGDMLFLRSANSLYCIQQSPSD